MEKTSLSLSLDKLYDLTHSDFLDYDSNSPEGFRAFKITMSLVANLISDLRSSLNSSDLKKNYHVVEDQGNHRFFVVSPSKQYIAYSYTYENACMIVEALNYTLL